MRFNGKLFTIAFAIVTAVLFASIFLISNRQTQLAELLGEQRSAWPKAAEVLATRFDLFDAVAAKLESENPDLANQWASSRKAFAKSTLYDQQARHVSSLIELSQKLTSSLETPVSALTDAERKSVDAFIAIDRKREHAQEGWIGKTTSKILFLRYPEPLYEQIDEFLPK